MSYKLYTDKNGNFECEVSVKNASLKGSVARLVVESPSVNLIFNGTLNESGCIIPIRKVGGLLDENTRGNMYLEVIVEGTYFKPWQSDFVVEEHTSVKVKVNENVELSNKPIVKVKMVNVEKPKKQSLSNIKIPLNEISSICEMFGIGRKNVRNKKSEVAQILREYFKANREYNKHKLSIIRNIDSFLK